MRQCRLPRQLYQLDCRVFPHYYGDRNGKADADPGAEQRDYSKIVPSVFKEASERGQAGEDLNEEVAEHLGAAIVNLVNMFNPEALILGGDLAHGNPELLDMVSAYIDRHAMPILKDDMVFGLASLGEEDKLMGAASVLLQDLLGFSLME